MDIRIKEWEKLNYIDPSISLPKIYQIQLEVSQSNLSQEIKDLRTRSLKSHLERRTAAIFCYGISRLMNVRTLFAPAPKQYLDYDVVARYGDKDTLNYVPIQIKETVPKRINPKANLNKTIDDLKDYPDSKETVVVIHDNSTGHFKLEDLVVPKLNIAALWILGCSELDQSKWFIAGDLLTDKAKIFQFSYPRV